MMPDKADIVVIGGGVIGASIAYHLSRQKLKVVLLEKKNPAAGSSGACGGTIFLQTKSPGIHLEMALDSARRFAGLEEELGAGFEYRRCGGMIVIEREDELPAVKSYVEEQKKSGLEVSLLDREQARELEPSLSETILGAAFSPIDAQVNPLLLTFAFVNAAINCGAEVFAHTRVSGLQIGSNRIKSVQTDRGEIKTETVVNAAGAHAAEIGALAELEIPIRPRKGQLVVTEAAEPVISRCLLSAQYIDAKYNPAQAQESGGVSIEPTVNGNILMGSTREFAGFNKDVSLNGIHHIARHVLAIVPCLKKLRFIRAFAGLRPYTPDGMPILGNVTGLDGFIMAAGHEGDGIALAPITGEVIADLIVNGKTAYLVDDYNLSRFSS